jgi:hypothetical protein
LRTFDQKYFLAKRAIYARQLYICGKKKHHHHGFMKKVPFFENFTTQTFLEQSALLPPKLKLFFFLCHYHVKAEGRSIPEHPDIINASMNLRKKLFLELIQCSFTDL